MGWIARGRAAPMTERPRRTFIACLGTETNTWSPLPTGLATFRDTLLRHGDATRLPGTLYSDPLIVWRACAEARGHEVIEGIAAFAEPAGPTSAAVYERLVAELLDGIRAALPLDIVLLNLHGAMVATGEDDCEGDILARVRSLVGRDVVIGAELDLHCHLTARMVREADALVIYKEYPHTDVRERAAELFAICADAAAGEVRPVMAAVPLHMVGIFGTTDEPLAGFVRRMRAVEQGPGILSVSLAHGFPYGDVADVGAAQLVVADGDADLAARTAEVLAAEVWALREAIASRRLSTDGAIDAALAHPGHPVVLADVADNAGGGAPSDSTFLVRRIIERGVRGVASGLYWDPLAVRLCMEAGEGATLDLRVGGKVGPASGVPLDLRVTVVRIVPDAHQTFGPSSSRVGDLVWVSADGDLDLVLNTVRVQTFHPDAFTQLGIDLGTRRLVVVKSMHHFHAGFAPVASRIIHLAGPGALPSDYAAMPFTKRPGPFWPATDDPHGPAGPRATIRSA